MKPISFIQPSRNNLKYLKWSYNSIRKNLGYRHEICMADDFSNDGTWEWLQEIAKTDPNVKILVLLLRYVPSSDKNPLSRKHFLNLLDLKFHHQV